MMYLFLKAVDRSPDEPYRQLFVTITESGGGWVSLYGGEKGQAAVLEQNEFPSLEAAVERGQKIRDELLGKGWRPYHPAFGGLNRSSCEAALAVLQRWSLA
jgi:hypothetical protein